jgi:hypothetical protein
VAREPAVEREKLIFSRRPADRSAGDFFARVLNGPEIVYASNARPLVHNAYDNYRFVRSREKKKNARAVRRRFIRMYLRMDCYRRSNINLRKECTKHIQYVRPDHCARYTSPVFFPPKPSIGTECLTSDGGAKMVPMLIFGPLQ